MDDAELEEILERLASLGAIHLPGQTERPTSLPPPSRKPANVRAAPGLKHLLALAAEDAMYDPREIEASCGMPREWRTQILDLFYAAPHLTHYEVLGVSSRAEKASIKQAYYEIVAFAHPDKYFGKELGPFKEKLAAVFQRVSDAHDILVRKQTRAEYDAELIAREVFAGQRRTREPMSMRPGGGSPSGSAPASQPESSLRVSSASRPQISNLPRPMISNLPRAQTVPDPPPDQEARQAQPPPPPESHPATITLPRSISVNVVDSGRSAASPLPADGGPEVRIPVRHSGSNAVARAMRLLRSRSLSPDRGSDSIPAPPPRPSPSTIASTQAEARQQLKQFYEARRQAGDPPLDLSGGNQVDRLLAMAKESMAEDRPICAVNILQVAQTLAPDRADVLEQLNSAKAAGMPQVADAALSRAKALQQQGMYEAAADAFRRAGAARPEGWIFQRAAECLLEGGGSLRDAREAALRAVELQPDKPEFHVTLARIYLAANKPTSGVKSLERAAALAPEDTEIARELEHARQAARG
jgi:curved DNA-binding protein CbpA/Flp pilus assembly protein TadD